MNVRQYYKDWEAGFLQGITVGVLDKIVVRG